MLLVFWFVVVPLRFPMPYFSLYGSLDLPCDDIVYYAIRSYFGSSGILPKAEALAPPYGHRFHGHVCTRWHADAHTSTRDSRQRLSVQAG